MNSGISIQAQPAPLALKMQPKPNSARPRNPEGTGVVDDRATAFGQRVYRGHTSGLDTALHLPARGSTTGSVFAPMQLERRVLLVLLPIMILTTGLAWLSSSLIGHATFVEAYQLGPLCLVMVALYLWILRTRPMEIWKPRTLLLLLVCGMVTQRFAVGLWYTAVDGYNPAIMRDMLPWMILGSMLCILLIPGRRGAICAFANYGVSSFALVAFLVMAPDALNSDIAFDLALTHLAGHLLIIVGMIVFARIRVAYGKALARGEDLEALALEDALTGILTRRAFTLAFKRARARRYRKNTPVSLLLIDIDHFKAVNDDLGHTVGDHALRAMAGLLLSELRPTDEVFRCGGEEFLILLEETALQSAWEVAERVRKRIETSALIHGRTLTVSIGVAELAEEESEVELFSRADVALYQAKHGGRNQVSIAHPPQEDTGA